jgi:8-oxo-dGTP pyrophosphatase MutT (NUDIX family)
MNTSDSSGTRREQDCEACVAQLPGPDRLAAMLAAIGDECEPIVTLTQLLRYCSEQHRLLWERSGDAVTVRQVAAVVEQMDPRLPAPGEESRLSRPVRDALVATLAHSSVAAPVIVARALADLLDKHYGHTFAAWFRERSPYRPGAGDPIPLGGPDLRHVMAMRATSPPWRLAHRLDETRHVRLAGDWALQFQVLFDYALFDSLEGVVTAETVVAAIQPNRSLDELDLARGPEGRAFPVRPRDIQRQQREIEVLLDQAGSAGASIVVLPELSVTLELATSLRERVQRPSGPTILVAGSYHHASPHEGAEEGRHRNTAVAWVRGHEGALTHDKHSPAAEPVVEDIQPDGWPELRVYVTADGWHLTIAICRDLLNPQAVNALSDAGVNLLLVPAMSETLVPFGGPVAHLVSTCQALVVVANNPADWSAGVVAGSRPARALFGHPGLGQHGRAVRPSDPGPGIALLRMHSAEITWLPSPSSQGPAELGSPTPQPRTGAEPGWLDSLVRRTDMQPSATSFLPSISLRRAAVLVLLTDGPAGPRVLLTERAADLSDYPGQLVFPGGAVDASDADAVTTALREAQEEVGLDPRSVEVIGLLTPRVLPRSGFLVDPVLAWSATTALRESVNHSEVTAVHQVALSELSERRDRRLQEAAADSGAATGRPELATMGRMTAAIVDELLDMLA